MIERQVRELQTHLPVLHKLKWSMLNLISARLGRRIGRDYFFLQRLRPFRLALDIGANWGQSIIALQRTAAPRQIISFEPNRLLADRLARRYAAREDIEIRACGLGEAEGQFTLHVPFYRDFPFDGLASMDQNEALSFLDDTRMARFDRRKLTSRAFDVEVSRLDALDLDPDLVKIDVQGLELAVVKGGIETFRRNRPAALIEMPCPRLVELLGEIGLDAYYFDGERLQPFRRQWKNALFLTPDHVARSGVQTAH